MQKEYQQAIVYYSMFRDPNWVSSTTFKRRGVAYMHLKQYDKALADFSRAVEMRPSDSSNLRWFPSRLLREAPVEFQTKYLALANRAIELTKGSADAYAVRGILFADLGHYDKSRADFRKATEIGNVGVFWNYGRALRALFQEDQHDYRNVSAVMLDQFAESQLTKELYFTTWTCVLAPGAVDDYSPAIVLAKRAANAEPMFVRYQQCLGAVLFRAGRFNDALKHLNKAAESQDFEVADLPGHGRSTPAYSWYFLAMTHHNLGNKPEAKEWFDKAVEWTERDLDDNSKDHQLISWRRRLTLELLRTETQELFRTTAAVARKPDQKEN